MMETPPVAILVIEDDVVDQKALRRAMANCADSYQLTFAASLSEGLAALATETFALVLLDNALGDGSGLEILNRTAETNTPAVIITGTGSESLASKAFRGGAYDYVVKDSYNAYLQLLPDIIRNVLNRKRAEDERDRLQAELQTALDTIQTLQGLVPICSGCKKVRDDEGFWQQVEQYISERSSVRFSHGICPQCFEQSMAELDKEPR
jgi:DNA-binding NtrC family response regulator